MTFFKFKMIKTLLGFFQPNFIKMRQMIIKRVIRCKLIVIKKGVTIRVKEADAHIIKKDLIASDKHSFKQVIKDQMTL